MPRRKLVVTVEKCNVIAIGRDSVAPLVEVEMNGRVVSSFKYLEVVSVRIESGKGT